MMPENQSINCHKIIWSWVAMAILLLNASVSVGQIRWSPHADGVWSAGANWVGGVAPGAGDTVVIDVQDVNQPDYWVTMDYANWEIDYLNLSTSKGGFRMTNRNFMTRNGAWLNGKVEMQNSTWSTDAGYSISNGGEFRMWSSLGIGHNTNNIDSNFVNSGWLDFQANARQSHLVIGGDMGNTGNISFRNNNGGSSILTVNGAGQFLNTGLIKAFAPTVGLAGSSVIRANQFNNASQVVNESGNRIYFDRAGASYTNGSIFAGTNGGFSFTNFGSFTNLAGGGNIQATGLSFVGQGSGASLMTNDDTIHALAGTLNIQNTTIVNSGSISGAAGTELTMSGVNYSGSGTLSGFDSAVISASTLGGQATFHNVMGHSLTLEESTFNTLVNNSGLIQQDRTNASRVNSMNGGLINQSTGEVEIRYAGTGGWHATSTLNVDGNIDNYGSIALQSRRASTGYQGYSYLQQTNGTLTNHAGGLLEARNAGAGIAGVNYIRTDSLVNNGTIRNRNVSALVFDRSGAAYTNNGLIDSESWYTHFNDFGSFVNSAAGSITGQHFYGYGLSSSAGTFSNAGSITLADGGLTLLDVASIDNSGTMNISGGNIAVSSFGTFTNSGLIQSSSGRSVTFSGGAYNHNSGASLAGGDNLTFTGSVLNLNTAFNTDFPNVLLTNTTVNGPGSYGNSSGTTLTLEESTFNTLVNNSGLIQQDRTNASRVNSLNGGLINQSTGEVEIRYAGTGGWHATSTLNVDGNIDNYGSIALQSRRASTGYQGYSYLQQTNGTLTNHAGGLLEARDAGAGIAGVNYIRTDSLVNNGTIRNGNTSSLIFDRSNASYLNTGIIRTSVGAIVFQNVGTFINQTGGVLDLENSSLTVTGTGATVINEVDAMITGNHALALGSGVTLLNKGSISPGSSPGQLTINGSVDFASTSELVIELGGSTQGLDFDYLRINGSLNLDGILSVSLYNGFVPDSLDSFTILTADNLNGFFSNALNELVFSSGTFDVTYNGNEVTLSNFSAIPEPGFAGLMAALVAIVTATRRSRRRVQN